MQSLSFLNKIDSELLELVPKSRSSKKLVPIIGKCRQNLNKSMLLTIKRIGLKNFNYLANIFTGMANGVQIRKLAALYFTERLDAITCPVSMLALKERILP